MTHDSGDKLYDTLLHSIGEKGTFLNTFYTAAHSMYQAFREESARFARQSLEEVTSNDGKELDPEETQATIRVIVSGYRLGICLILTTILRRATLEFCFSHPELMEILEQRFGEDPDLTNPQVRQQMQKLVDSVDAPVMEKFSDAFSNVCERIFRTLDPEGKTTTVQEFSRLAEEYRRSWDPSRN